MPFPADDVEAAAHVFAAVVVGELDFAAVIRCFGITDAAVAVGLGVGGALCQHVHRTAQDGRAEVLVAVIDFAVAIVVDAVATGTWSQFGRLTGPGCGHHAEGTKTDSEQQDGMEVLHNVS